MGEPLIPLMTTPEVANFYGVPIDTVYQWRHRGVGPKAVRIGRYLRFRREDVEAWLVEREQQQGDRTTA